MISAFSQGSDAIVFRTVLLLTIVLCPAFVSPPSASAQDDLAKKVLLIAGPRSHAYGAHEHYAGLKVLQQSLNEANASLDIEVVRGWPEDASTIQSADAVVIYCDGGGRHVAMDHRDQLRELLTRGGGLVCLHYAVEMVPGEPGDDMVELLGGHFEIHHSVNPHWIANFETFPDHPIATGVEPFATNDEWYFHLRFADSGKLTPILQAIAPEDTMRRGDGAHSGNPKVRKSVAAGEPQTVAWAYEPDFGGRSFGFTGGHHHWNWSHVPVRRLVTNAIRWAAGDDPSVQPKTMQPIPAETLMADQDYDVPKNFKIEDVATKFEIPATTLTTAPNSNAAPKTNSAPKANSAPKSDTSAKANTAQPQLLVVTPLVNTKTSRHRVDLEVDLTKINDSAGQSRRIFLVATDGGDGFSCDHVAWLDPTLVDSTGIKPSLDLVDLDWASASTGWGEVRKNANAEGGPVRVRNENVSRTAIGAHAPSVIEFEIPAGYDKLTVTPALESGGTNQNDGQMTSVRFAIYAGAAPANIGELDQKMESGQRDPASAIAGLEVAPGLAVTLMGSEPDLSSLTNLDVDHRGRVWVCDVMNYRRNNDSRPEGDRILILEDTTGDGVLDSVKTYYQGRDIDSAMGICVLGNDVIVSASPTIWKFTDSDGDDVPDSKVAMFTDVGQPQHDHSAHSFLFGDDGKLYWNFGNTGGQVKDANGEIVVDIHGRPVVDNGRPFFGGMPFRCDLDGSNFEVLAHNFRNNWETTVDSFGALWQSDNDDDGNRGTRINFVMEQGNYGYLDERTGDSWRADRITLEDEIPLRHWHLNDPGVVPNMLQTGAGSPSGICMYEGRLLPERFWDQVIHCEPGVNIVRAYPAKPDGAGYSATIEPLVTGTLDKWFRPADVCVAPDGSLFVTDWYDPGVGGHRQEDSNRGRLFRIAPPGVDYTVPEFDLETADGAAEALKNPNRSVRYLAWQKLHSLGGEAELQLVKLFHDENPRVRARALWLLGNIPGRGRAYAASALRDDNADIRCTAIRLCKQIGLSQFNQSPAEFCAALAEDPSPAVRRELALALRYDKSNAMPTIWARLAMQHDGNDRWMLEALGIGSDVRPTECYNEWMRLNEGNWNTPGGRDLVWRLRTDAAAFRMVELLSDPNLPIEDTNRYFRSLEYHPDAVRASALAKLLPKEDSTNEAKIGDEVLVRSVMRIPDFKTEDYPQTKSAIARYIDTRAGESDFITLIQRFQIEGLENKLTEIMVSTDDDNQSLGALRLLLRGKAGVDRFQSILDRTSGMTPDQSTRVASLLGTLGNPRAVDLLAKVAGDAEADYDARSAAVRGLAKSSSGAQQILSMVSASALPADTHLLAGGLLARNADESIARRASESLPQPAAADNVVLAPLDELVRMPGNVENGLALFRGVATCANCHIVDGHGKQVGPDLSEIGSKLSREAMFTSILAPSAGISHNYENTIALTEDGRVVSGVLVTQTEDKVVLRNAEAIDLEFPMDEIVELKKSEKSIMPDNLHQTTDQQGLVDLVEYLMTLKKK